MPGPLLMVNPRRRRKGRSRGPGRPRGPGGRFTARGRKASRRKNASRKYRKPSSTSSGASFGAYGSRGKRTSKRKSITASSWAKKRISKMKRSESMKKAWRKRKRAKAATTVKRTVKRRIKRRKPGRPRKATTKRTTKRRKSSKRARAARKAWRTRKAAMAGKAKRTYKRHKATTKRRTYKRRKRSRSRIMKTVWRKRKQGSYRRPRKGKRAYRKLYRTKTGRPFKRARRVGKSGRRTKRFQLWKNQTKDFFMTAGIAAIGAIAAAFLVKQLHEKVLSKNASTAKLNVESVSIIAGAAGAFLLFKYGNKLTKNKNLIYGLSMGLAFFSAITVMREYLIPQLPADLKSKLGLGSYVLGGYVHAPMRGYVHSNVRGYLTAPRSIAPGSMGALRDIGVGPAARFDTPTEGNERQYDKFRWQGVFSKSVFEN